MSIPGNGKVTRVEHRDTENGEVTRAEHRDIGNGKVTRAEHRDTENGELHKSDHSCNSNVQDLIARVKLTNTRECINSLYDRRASQEIRNAKEVKRVNERAEVLKSEIGGEER